MQRNLLNVETSKGGFIDTDMAKLWPIRDALLLAYVVIGRVEDAWRYHGLIEDCRKILRYVYIIPNQGNF